MKQLISKPLLGLAAVLVGCIAVAQERGNTNRFGPNRQGGLGGPMARFDTNKDGVLSADEVTAAKKSGAGRFIQMMDANQDGQIDADEMNSMRERMRERMRGGMTPGKSNEELSKGVPQSKDPDNLIFIYMNGTARNQEQAKNAYIINSDGKVLHKWDNSHITSPEAAPGYVTTDGLFLRGVESEGLTKAKRDEFAVGVWGTLQLVNWDNNVVWQYDSFKDGKECFHHDVVLMPNGNILATAFRKYTEQEAARFGWNKQGQSKLLFDVIYELKPNLRNGTTEIVWEWRWTDHVIQDGDKTLPNYGVVADHPGRVDLHFTTQRTSLSVK